MKKLLLASLFFIPASLYATSYDSGSYGNFSVPVASVSASGTAYALTATTATLDFGTIDPSFTISQPGTYVIFSRAALFYNGATFAGNRNILLKLRRTNNTAADLTGASTTFIVAVVTILTYEAGAVNLPVVLYTTTNADDVIALQGAINAVPAAGSMEVTEADIQAIRIK